MQILLNFETLDLPKLDNINFQVLLWNIKLFFKCYFSIFKFFLSVGFLSLKFPKAFYVNHLFCRRKFFVRIAAMKKMVWIIYL